MAVTHVGLCVGTNCTCLTGKEILRAALCTPCPCMVGLAEVQQAVPTGVHSRCPVTCM
jgi:hypothetical protein